jgi:acyl-CoA synthetase (AMP-forming)/AMP-acid ligase II/3-oxoacyl-(acyl-carrier-protein) synthase/thioesterase domain-containing protein/acyl carrier protein
MNVASWSDVNIQRYGVYDAVVAGRVWTSVEMQALGSRFARRLTREGLQPGERVALLLPNGPDLVAAFDGTLRAGGVAVPLFSGLRTRELENALALTTPTVLVTTADLAQTHSAIARPGVRVITDGLLDEHPPADIADDAGLTVPVPRSLQDPALVCYTSGTGGTPKAVVHTHGSLHARHGGGTRRNAARVLAALPLGTLGASMLTGRLAHQHTLILQERFEPRAFLRAIADFRITKLVLMPSMAEAIVAQPDVETFDLSSLKSVNLTGAAISPELFTRLAAIVPVQPSVVYGMTETGGGIAATGMGTKPGSVGRILRGVQVRIVKSDGRDAAQGEAGEIHVRTPWMAAGYLRTGQEPANGFDDEYIRTGDLGYVDADGELFLTGRLKDIITQNGMKILPREVATVIRQLDGVAECEVVGAPHAMLGEQVVACVVREPEAQIAEAAIINHCRRQLDPRKSPIWVRFLDQLPRNAAQKIDQGALRHLVAAGPARQPDVAPLPASRPERLAAMTSLLLACVRNLLPHRAPRGVTFGDMGLDSVAIAQLAHAVGVALGRAVSPIRFYNSPTVASLAEYLCDGVETPQPAGPTGAPASFTDAPIAIIGCACRLPGGIETPHDYWSLLERGQDATSDITRWNVDEIYSPDRGTPGGLYTKRAALLREPDRFDAEFFGFSPREARDLDSQNRLLFEVTWEACERAGYDPAAFSTGVTGMFLGISAPTRRGQTPAATPSMSVGRLCHFFDLKGPALAIDTACSSSLAAIHTAMQSLRLGECDAAFAGGVHVIADLESFLTPSRLNLLAADGRCKAFGATADGFGRGEGCVVFVLKRLADAVAAGDRVEGVLLGSAVRHDGRSSSLTAPNGRAQQNVIRAALANARVEPDDVSYLEAHGTGTPVGDPIEVEAAVAVLGNRGRRLTIGSAKGNIGHLEAAAGAAGLLKVVLALRQRVIPPHLHCEVLNPLLSPFANDIEVPLAARPWQAAPSGRRMAGVTSMGLSGTNVHVVVGEGPSPEPAQATAALDQPTVLCVSARTDEALSRLVNAHSAQLATVSDDEFGAYCRTAALGRAHFSRRLAIVASTAEGARALLSQATAGRVLSASTDAGAGRSEACDLAEQYVRGESVDWHGHFGVGSFTHAELPTYPFERVAPVRRDSRPQRHNAPRQRSARRPGGGLHADVLELVRQQVANNVGRPIAVIADDTNCLDLGLDSVGVIDVVAGLNDRLGTGCLPGDFLAHPTVAAFARHLRQRLESTDDTAGDASPLVTLSSSERGPALYCIHPSGGEVTAYLQLRDALAGQATIVGVQSRALREPAREYDSIDAMADAYAAAIVRAANGSSISLVGWSMGGLAALAVASELERQDVAVDFVGLIDAAPPERYRSAPPAAALALILTAIGTEVESKGRVRSIRAVDVEPMVSGTPLEILRWCEETGRFPASAISPSAFESRLLLYQQHWRIAGACRAPIVRAPIREWHAARSQHYDWTRHTHARCTATALDGSHFTVMMAPSVDTVARGLLDPLAPVEVGAFQAEHRP